MRRRRVIGLRGASVVLPVDGCIGDDGGATGPTPTPADTPTSGDDPNAGDLEVELEETRLDPDRIAPEDPPEITVEDETTVVVEGAIMYGSSTCGTVEPAHVAFERSESRLDVLVVAADATDDAGSNDDAPGTPTPCSADLVATGDRIEVTVTDGTLRRVSATEHHVFGDTYSAHKDLTDY